MATANKLTPNVIAKTANYTVTTGDFGAVFTNRGATGAVTFTLPAAAGNSGAYIWVFVVAGQNVTVAAATGELVAFNDATANSVAFSTALELIGGGGLFMCDGTSWLAMLHLGAETQTPTVAT